MNETKASDLCPYCYYFMATFWRIKFRETIALTLKVFCSNCEKIESCPTHKVLEKSMSRKFKHPLEVRKYWREKQRRYRAKKKNKQGSVEK